ncbi:ATP-binding protein [Campylobacter sp. RM9344]|uniref:ATP-binding protein n=1 Tax=Campylobacter californiensis TaxID=1032243 RepID=A0AAW3ZS84_9BACT|nr:MULTISPECIES: ATP-binding protein [unclassified Campylobacter]MBE2984205.1 ATP-binding protein [Campylobacter sp. RM6883]MBE2986039.1 ATP-binding protein [Campylobacter sp. RM12919]MBE2988281.1 ATP-binding protein [Campylobacter sp. RM12920]MBE2994928.1 ATP-binding protein [Campylobacter sp. RM6913]MBE3029434.1 ATP-binding protein [Campylobacter sp. RM9344]
MSNNIYADLKEIFINEDDINSFVNLDKTISCYNKIISVIKKPLKLVLFYGKPGTGKTFLLNKIVKDLGDNQKQVIFFSYPFFSETSFVNALCDEIFTDKKENINNFEELIQEYGKKFANKKEILENQIVIILDEAQLYPQELIEKIRLMADSRYFKFIFTIHKTSEEDVIAKDYFQTRIWESIELKSADLNEVITYILKKISMKNLEKYLNFSDADFALIYDLCEGNLRTLNKLLYKFYEICEYYEKNEPSVLAAKEQNQKILIMSAIDTGLINA